MLLYFFEYNILTNTLGYERHEIRAVGYTKKETIQTLQQSRTFCISPDLEASRIEPSPHSPINPQSPTPHQIRHLIIHYLQLLS